MLSKSTAHYFEVVSLKWTLRKAWITYNIFRTFEIVASIWLNDRLQHKPFSQGRRPLYQTVYRKSSAKSSNKKVCPVSFSCVMDNFSVPVLIRFEGIFNQPPFGIEICKPLPGFKMPTALFYTTGRTDTWIRRPG